MEKEKLDGILNLHKLWLNDESTGKRADLRSANLRSANLRSANLRSADLSGANLSGANLSGADLISANLSGANLISADLRSANLSGADLSGADLRSANLSGANLRSASLRSANLSGADLRSAILFCEGVMSKTIHQILGLYYHVYLLDSHIKIGCEIHTIQEWRDFSDGGINRMDTKALEFWKRNKNFIMSFYERDVTCGK